MLSISPSDNTPTTACTHPYIILQEFSVDGFRRPEDRVHEWKAMEFVQNKGLSKLRKDP
jgi:hypothetical protein